MDETYNNLELSECGSDIFRDFGNFQTERFSLQLNGTWQSDLTISSGKTDVYFNDGVSKIDMVIAYEESHENSRSVIGDNLEGES